GALRLRARVMTELGGVASELPKMSRTWTTTAGVMTVPKVVLVGCWVNVRLPRKSPWKPGVAGCVSVPNSRKGMKLTAPLTLLAMNALLAAPHQLAWAVTVVALRLFSAKPVFPDRSLP